MGDLVVLVADKDAEYIVSRALARPAALGIRAIASKIITHSGHDGGVRKHGPGILRLERRQFRHALMILDYEGCGASVSAAELERAVDSQLADVWGDHAKCVVIDPEVDRWIWGNEQHLREVTEWSSLVGIRDWLADRGFTFDANQKPDRPKEAFGAVCRHSRIPRSSSLYGELASRISLARCADPAFVRTSTVLRGWFAPTVEE